MLDNWISQTGHIVITVKWSECLCSLAVMCWNLGQGCTTGVEHTAHACKFVFQRMKKLVKNCWAGVSLTRSYNPLCRLENQNVFVVSFHGGNWTQEWGMNTVNKDMKAGSCSLQKQKIPRPFGSLTHSSRITSFSRPWREKRIENKQAEQTKQRVVVGRNQEAWQKQNTSKQQESILANWWPRNMFP